MPRFAASLRRLSVGLALLLCLGVARAGAAQASGGAGEFAALLPLLTGNLRGVFTPVEGRALAWSVAWSESDGAASAGELSVTGADFSLRIALGYDLVSGRLGWRVTEGRVDLAAWAPALAKRPDLAAGLDGLAVTGVLKITGAGEWAGGVHSGELRAVLAEGEAGHAAQGWSVSGVTVNAGGDVAGLVKGRVPVELTVRTITTGRFGARNFSVKATLVDFARVEVGATEVEIAGGWLRAAPFALSLAEPRLGVDLTMERVGLQDVAALVPETLTDARGRVNGAVRLNWSEADGVSVGRGHLSLDASEVTTVRFRPNPGLLTSSLPPQVLQHYPGLLKIETGETPLLAARLDVRLSPEGDGEGRSVVIHIEGEPVNPSLKAPLVLTINVRGPLGPLMKFGFTPGLGAGGGK